MQDAIEPGHVETRTRVFISYSRKDLVFADKIEVALKAHGFEVLIDREEIYAFEDWWRRVEALIGGADTVVFVLSPDAVRSEVALKEVKYAASMNKRFAPIVWRKVEDGTVPDALRRLNFIFFDDPEQFEGSTDRLAKALRTDIAWVRRHTEFGETAHRWVEAGRPSGMLLRPPVLDQAEAWLAFRPDGAPAPTVETRTFIAQGREAIRNTQKLRRFAVASMFMLLVGIILGLVAWINQDYLKDQWTWYTTTRPFAARYIWPYVISKPVEEALQPDSNKSFRECIPAQLDIDYCPDMVVVPAGSFMMGSAPGWGYPNEYPRHQVTMARPFAVSKLELTFGEWDTCVVAGGCRKHLPNDFGWTRGRQPVFNVSWEDAQQYVIWLSRVTGKPYRLLTEAEYEYATRAGTTTIFPWGDVVGEGNANCVGCGTPWNDKQTAPVGSFAPNKFGLYDMVGNVWEWVEDCFHPAYEIETQQGKVAAPRDGSAWIDRDCDSHVTRGGSWANNANDIRSPSRYGTSTGYRGVNTGFRVGRTLSIP